MPVDSHDPITGRVLDRRYRVGPRIARGGMASVYEAYDVRLDRRIAVKVMHPHLADDEHFRERFIQEARSAARLGHPNVVNTFDQGEEDGIAWLVMELVPSITLRDLLVDRGALTPRQVLDVLDPLLAGLAAAHRAGIVHRDLKPENILLAHDGRIKIGDFGLARAATDSTGTGKALLGTIAYLSPELVTRGVADTRSDMYAIGIMLFEMLVGEQPYRGGEPMQIAFQHANAQVPLPSEVSDHPVPEALDGLVRWATHRDPNLRPGHAAEMLAEVREIREGGASDRATRVLAEVDEHDGTTAVIAPSTSRSARAGERGTLVDDAGDGVAAAALARRAAARRRRGGVWLALVLLGALLAVAVGWWFNTGPGGHSTVPDVAGITQEAAVAALAARSIAVSEVVTEHDYDVPAGAALGTVPEAGARIGNQEPVRLLISAGRQNLAVPLLEGLTLDEARAEIDRAGFTVAEGEPDGVFDADRDAGTVIVGFDVAGTPLSELDELEERSPVSLRYSLGAVPAAAGQDADEARAALQDARLIAAFSTSEHSLDVAEGALISIEGPQGRYLRPGDTVAGVVSLGPAMIAVPDVTGLPISEAVELIEQAGFEPELHTNVPGFLRSTVQVREQSPHGTEAPEGSVVRIEATYP